ncbi:39S ribosomal protein L52, mitochondrial [Elysia marginata]|uniref:Large ribosomal subunit protein mL52 n=1 Tax=Elysia marginata TaxID=1093978 RepID=A0AAV4G8C1_9GAST|nr:39S ribosomal protein L52, mitochondrial [Elysia marginata]
MQTLLWRPLKKGHNLPCVRFLQETLCGTLSVVSSNKACIHTSCTHQKDRRKDRAISQYLYYRDHEKTMRHRNLPLMDLPDYSYTDGRPTELSLSQTRRQQRNYDLAKRIVQLVGEMKQAENLHQEHLEAEAARQRGRRENRLMHKQTQFKV